MNDPHAPDLPERLTRLEAQVADLRAEVAKLQQTLAEPPGASVRPVARPREARAARPAFSARWHMPWRSEEWLNKLGIGLLLFGVAFLFKYSIDAGWLTPLVRVLFGGALGVFLLGVGLRLRHQAGVRAGRARLGQFLLGGSIATFYGTLFAAFQFYALLPYTVAFVGMVVVTALAFGLAVRQDDAALAVVGVAGGLATPFLLYTDAGSVPGLVGYTAVVLAGAAAVYALRGWRTLLAAAYVGAWTVLGLALLTLPEPPPAADRWALRLGVLYTWLLFAGVTLVFAWQQGEASVPTTTRSWWRQALHVLARRPDATLAFTAPLLALRYTQELWTLTDEAWGSVALGGAGLYAGLTLLLHRRSQQSTTPGQPSVATQARALASAVLLAYGLVETLPEPLFLVALALEGAGLHLLASRVGWPGVRLAAHLLFGLLAVILIDRLNGPLRSTRPLLNADALAEASILALAVATALQTLQQRPRQIVLLTAHVLWMALLLVELRALPSGQAFVTAAWGAYTIGLLILGVRRDWPLLRNAALATVLVVVAKLFLVDLVQIDALWRVLLFLGFGGLFLLLSYWLSGRFGGESQD